MSNNNERKKTADTISNKLIPMCCNGNKDAEAYLKRIFYVVRRIDDLHDGDYEVNNAEIIRGFFFLIADIPNNPFYRTHMDKLMGVHLIGLNAWKDSNAWQNSNNDLKKLYAHVFRDYICELFILVAYLCGGEQLMQKVSLKVRQSFLKKQGE